MVCPAIVTGEEFLLRTLTHIDCQVQRLGSYGYLALGEPGSTASILMTMLLTVFVALFGFRLMFGTTPRSEDLVLDVIRIGVALTLAFSWPAFRTLVYDVALTGPAEIVNQLFAGSEGETLDLTARLQRVDDLIMEFTQAGTGRTAGAFIDSSAPGGTFEAAVLEDESTLGFARLAYLAGIIGSVALLRIAAGLLLAITPLIAGTLLFGVSRGLFLGWLKGLILTIMGSVGAATVLIVELAILEPWLVDALRVRDLGYATPAAPTELLAITLAFAFALVAMTWLLSRMAFHISWPAIERFRAGNVDTVRTVEIDRTNASRPSEILPERNVARSIERAILRQELSSANQMSSNQARSVEVRAQADAIQGRGKVQPLGQSYRRVANRRSASLRSRDGRK